MASLNVLSSLSSMARDPFFFMPASRHVSGHTLANIGVLHATSPTDQTPTMRGF
jgi:hypothetical protein